MKAKSRKQRIKELVDYIQNYEMYQNLFDEIDRDIRKTLERRKKKMLKTEHQRK
jgi:hypothetical protein